MSDESSVPPGQPASGAARLARILDAVPGVIYEFFQPDVGQEHFTFVSGRAEEQLGEEADQLTTMAPGLGWELAHPDDIAKLMRALAEGRHTLKPMEHELRTRGAEGWRWVRIRQVPHKEPDGVRWTGVSLDVTEEKRLSDQVRHSQRLEVLGDLTTGVAHNFNNLLGVIMPNVQMAHDDAPAPLQPLLQDALDAAESAAALVRQLLLLARPEKGATGDRFDAAEAARDTGEMCRRTFSRTLQVELNLPPGSVYAAGSATPMRQVLLNLIINARDAVEGVENPAVSLTLTEHPELVVITVTDNGKGIAEEHRVRIGEPFFTTKGPGRGTGLGLATAWRIVREAGGTLTFRPGPDGRGTVFEVVLRRLPPPAASPRGGRAKVSLAGIRVLLVDDEDMVRTAVRRALVSSSATVVEAASGVEALAVLSAVPCVVDVVLLDLAMPGMDGIQVLRQLRTLHPTLPVAIVSGHALEPVAGANATMVKPVPLQDLFAFVAQARPAEPTP